MGKYLYELTRKKLSELIVITLLSKFDYFLVVEGNRGTGKSTLAVHLMKGVSSIMKKLYSMDPRYIEYYYKKVRLVLGLSLKDFIKKIKFLKEKKAYVYKPEEALIYKREEVIKFFGEGWYKTGNADEMVNVTFNRDFYNEDQKSLIKLINMNRDHSNFFIACVPSFETLDTQIKQLCKMRIVIERRSVGIIHTPNKFTFSRDKWDSKSNEKIERSWYKGKNTVKPKYAQLSTARAIVKFPPLPAKQQERYDEIKTRKRNDIWKEQQAVENKDKDKTPVKPIDMITDLVKNKLITNEKFNEIVGTFNIKPSSAKAMIRTRLRDQGIETKLGDLLP